MHVPLLQARIIYDFNDSRLHGTTTKPTIAYINSATMKH